MTNLEKIRNLPIEQLAKLLVYEVAEQDSAPIYDEYFDKTTYSYDHCFNPSLDKFSNKEEAVKNCIKYLKSEESDIYW